MTTREFLLEELDSEVARSRKALQQMPEGKSDWKPHERSMAFGYLAELVAIIPSWVALQVTKDELDIAPESGSAVTREPLTTKDDYLAALDKAAADARTALNGTTDEHLATSWRLKAKGVVVQQAPRSRMIQDTFAHLSHHRGQMTVYLRLMGAAVPALFGPSADEKSF